MERDFLGINGKDSGGLVKDESSGTQKDSAFVGGSAVQWPFSNRIASLQHLMSFKTIQDEKPKNAAFNHLASSGFHPIIASTIKEAPQQCFGLDRQGALNFSMHAYHPQRSNALHPSIPVSMSGPFFKVQGSSNAPNLSVASVKQQSFGGFIGNDLSVMSSGVGTFVPRNASKPTSPSQLTIFYAGSVNVYDDVLPDQAQEIMLMASKACNVTSNNQNQRPETPFYSLIHEAPGVNGLKVNHTQDQTRTETETTSQVSSPMSDTSHRGAQLKSNSSTNDVMGMKNVGPLSPALSQLQLSQATDTSTPIVPIAVPQVRKASLVAVPQARKASLTRFLAKRKERVTDTMPYPCAKKSDENSTGFGGANTLSKCLSVNLSLSNNRMENSFERKDSPSTQLEM